VHMQLGCLSQFCLFLDGHGSLTLELEIGTLVPQSILRDERSVEMKKCKIHQEDQRCKIKTTVLYEDPKMHDPNMQDLYVRHLHNEEEI
jgi:hypothetical protein